MRPGTRVPAGYVTARKHPREPFRTPELDRAINHLTALIHEGGTVKPADEVRSLTCHCGRIACRHHTGATMNPITRLSLAHIGKPIRIVDDAITLTGVLTAIDAEREVIHEGVLCVEGEQLTAGAWENITVTVGPNQISLSPSAEWEPA